MKNKSLYIIMFISLLTFLSITFLLTEERGFVFDQTIMEWVDGISNSVIVKMMNVVSMIGSSEVILLITLGITVLFLIKRDWYHTIFFLSVSVVGVFFIFVLKLLFQNNSLVGYIN